VYFCTITVTVNQLSLTTLADGGDLKTSCTVCPWSFLWSQFYAILVKFGTVFLVSKNKNDFVTLSFNDQHFYARQLYRQVLLRARISYGNCVRPSVCPSVLVSRPGTESSPGEIETPGFHHMVA